MLLTSTRSIFSAFSSKFKSNNDNLVNDSLGHLSLGESFEERDEFVDYIVPLRVRESTRSFAPIQRQNLPSQNSSFGQPDIFIKNKLGAWEEWTDESSSRKFYLNRSTKRIQWTRPPSGKVIRNKSKSSEVTLLPPFQPVQVSITRVTTTEHLVNDTTHFRHICPAPPAVDSKADIARKENLARAQVADKCITKIEELGEKKKEGFLLKQSKYLGRRLRMYFVVDKNEISYYKDEGCKAGKTLTLSGASTVDFLAKENCICIKNLSRDGRRVELKVTTESDIEAPEWISTISGHIHAQFKIERKVLGDYWDEGDIAIEFWKLPSSDIKGEQRLPVEIRSLPFVDGPGTKEYIYPGETMEIVQTIDDQAKGVRFLRLAGGRGWVCDNYCKDLSSESFEKVKGIYSEETRVYQYPKSKKDSLPTFLGPSTISELAPAKHSILPGSTFSICAVWSPVSDSDESDDQVTYLKLTVTHVWVALDASVGARQINTRPVTQVADNVRSL